MSRRKPPAGFTLDEEDDLPPPPEGFSLDASAPETPKSAPPALGEEGLVAPVDGDTFRTTSGGSLRLYGVDAPELNQQGWNRQGLPEPIGRSAKAWLADALERGTADIGDPEGQSYGRTVAPVTIDDLDLGEVTARQGQALAAPRYLTDDPQRQFRYMQAERLARQNGLGIHDTLFQPPDQFRRDPMPSPSQETIALFWDTPTPMAGMRPEDETQYVKLLQTAKTPDEIIAFVESRGMRMDRGDVETWLAGREDYRSKGREIPAYAVYKEGPKPLTDLGDGSAGAAVRGFGSGALAGGLDEVGAFADTVGLTPGRESIWNSDRRIADVWANNRDQNAAILGYDDSAHPWATLGGELAGGLVVPFGARARTVPELFRVGAAYGGAQGFLGTEGDLGERAIGGAIGVPVGGALGAAGGKALEGALRAAPRLGRYVPQRFRSGAPEASGGPVEPFAGPSLDDVTNGSIPPPPDGFTIDVGQAAPSVPRQRDYLFPPRPAPLDQPLSEAQLQAATGRIDLRDVLPIPSNEVGSIDEAAAIDAGRFMPAKPVDEITVLERRGYNSPNGRLMPKRGPSDLVTWLRTQGGIKDQGGNLRAMGIGNAPRDLDFARGEQRFGKLVDNQNGMNLDDAAYAAWEMGYLPGSDRPDTNTFLDAIDRTHSGADRAFHPDDLPEVERFYATRDDRKALEAQLADGPVYVDRSVPADEPQPFPPPSAYEEWPAVGPDFAGNIDLRKLESPQDIKRALTTVHRQAGFDVATRGRISHAETDRLATQLGMTPETLMSRRKGQALNAEEALAARQLLAKSGNELVNAAKKIKALDEPGDELLAEFQEKLLRHVGIQEQVSGMTAEAGRALQQFRMAASSRAVRGDVLASLVNSGGGRSRLQDAAQVLLDALEESPGKFNATAEKVVQPRWRDKLTELWINSLLSGPQTHAVNIASNTLTALAQIPEHAGAALIGKARQALPGADIDRVVGSELGARVFGLIQGAKEGARLFAQSLRTGEPSDLVSKVEGQGMKAISGLKGEIVRVPTRMLTAEDEFFKGLARRMELNGLAVRQAHKEGLKGEAAKARIAELVANPPDDLLHASFDYARYVTFQQKLGPLASKVSGMTQDAPALKLFLPFVRTPTNLLKFATERSPAAPLLSEWRKDFLAGGARRDLAVAKAMIGTGFGAAIYQAALDGRITGSAPSDPAKSRLMQADGWQPYSIRVGDEWISYKRMDPFSTTLGVAADLATLPEGMSERQRDDAATLLVGSILGNLANKTWLSGLSDIIGALSEPDRKADNLVQRLAGSMAVPTGVAQVARYVDPVQRETGSVGDAIVARLPGLSKSLPPRLDVWGQPRVNEGGIGPDLISPAWVSTAKNDPVNRELMRAGVSVGMVPGKVGGVTLTPEQKGRYQALAGQMAHSALQRLTTSDQWQALDTEGRQDAAEKAIRDARSSARAVLFGKGPRSAPRKQVVPPPPEGFAMDGSAAGVNVYADLQRTIPGVRFTSGFRTPEYQADMRRRGYNPASNSGHLDGSALDMLPPEGKSMGWLKERVRKDYPDARLLIHDGHLHATFPGYWGAPALGGAKGAGLRNPNAGMPPPPAGFRLDR